MENYLEKVEYITLNLENCDQYVINQEDIYGLTLDNIVEWAGINIYGQFAKHKISKNVEIELRVKDYLSHWEGNGDENYIGFQKRMDKYKDINSISISDGCTTLDYYVDIDDEWNGVEIGFKNKNQNAIFDVDKVIIKIKAK